MNREPMWKRKLKLFFLDHWMKMAIVVFIVFAIALPWAILAMIDSYQRIYMLAWLSIMPLQAFVHSLIFVVLLYWLHYGGGFTKMAKKSVKSEQVNVRWKDVIGMEQAKLEAGEIVKLIKDHAKVQKIGGKMLRGLLMMGPPGCGKTYLAKAIATEAGMPFLAVTGAEFVEMFVGVGAGRVRSLFKKARRLAYGEGGCIIFIDEIDSLARKRSFNQFGGHEEGNSTQNQLLAEMDGMTEHAENIVVMGATNAPEQAMDEALLRPGRFDRKIYVRRPDVSEREDIFKYYLAKVKIDPKIDVGRLARKAVYKTPSDINNIVQEAALISTRNGKEIVDYKDITEAIDRIDLGFKHKLKMTERERQNVAYHETGHAIAVYYLHPQQEANYATIISRAGSLGHVQPVSTDEFYTRDKEVLLGDIETFFGGYVAEKAKFGVTTSGVSSDFNSAMSIAHNMAWRFGMGDSGLMGNFDAVPDEQLSDETKQQLNRDTQALLTRSKKKVEELLEREAILFEKFAQELLLKEELDYDQIQAICQEYGTKSPRALRNLKDQKKQS